MVATLRPGIARIAGLSKTYASNRVLDDAGLDLTPGRIHALLGGNGSGKSTLIKCLAGVVRADEGVVTVDGTASSAHDLTPATSAKLGFRFVHQTGALFPELTVAENLAAGGEGGWRPITTQLLRERAGRLLKQMQLGIDPAASLRSLNPSDQMMVAIARALGDRTGGEARFLVLDEPTAALTAIEVDKLVQLLHQRVRHQSAVLYVSHRLDEVLSLADDVTVLRDGIPVLSRTVAGMAKGELVQAIVGESRPILRSRGPSATSRRARIEVRDLAAGHVDGVTFSIGSGEIVGLAGLSGSGRSTILRALFGAEPMRRGSLLADGSAVSITNPGDAIKAGFAMVPEDRAAEGAFLDQDLTSNLLAPWVRRYVSAGRLSSRKEAEDSSDLVRRFGVKANSISDSMGSLSGGNQQKVVVARWLGIKQPRLLLLDEPTQGVDAGARDGIHHFISLAADRGTSVLVASSDFAELLSLCDRLFVLRSGQVVQEVQRGAMDEVTLTHLAAFSEEGDADA